MRAAGKIESSSLTGSASSSGGLAWRIDAHDTLASTSDLCILRARSGEPEGLVIVARAQTAGRGRGGAAWSSPTGNLAMSVLLRPTSSALEAGRWSLLAGLAVIEALSTAIARPDRLQLKWPNDITLDGHKLAGILIDSEATAGGSIAWLVIGIGANLAHAPQLPDRRTACLADVDAELAVDDAVAAILGRLDAWGRRLQDRGFAPVRAAWLDRGHPVGSPLAANTVAGRRTGRFAGLAPSGALLLAAEGEIHCITAAEVEPLQIDLPLPTS